MNALLAPRPRRLRTPSGFIAVAILFYLIDGILVHSPLFERSPSALAAVASIDLTFGLAAAWWILVVRAGNAARRTVLPVFVASIAAAMVTLPSGHRDLLAQFRGLAIPLELAVMGGVVLAVRRSSHALTAAGAELDVPERIRAALAGTLPSRVAAIVATETSMFFYALAAWRRKPFVPAGAAAFSYHRRNGFAALLYTAAALSVVEVLVVDLLVRPSHAQIANALLALDLLGFVWVIGFARAVQLRPILVMADRVVVRVGLQWSLEIPRTAIERVDFGRVGVPPRGTPRWIRGIPQPNAVLSLREPLMAEGPYGARREVQFVALALDDRESFRIALAFD